MKTKEQIQKNLNNTKKELQSHLKASESNLQYYKICKESYLRDNDEANAKFCEEQINYYKGRIDGIMISLTELRLMVRC